MTFTPTPEQLRIISAASSTPDNLIISALAGAAKTSTLVLIAEALPKTSILCISFNKKIATEMKERLPANCTSMTLNSLGHRVWGDTLGKRLALFDLQVEQGNFHALGSQRARGCRTKARSATSDDGGN